MEDRKRDRLFMPRETYGSESFDRLYMGWYLGVLLWKNTWTPSLSTSRVSYFSQYTGRSSLHAFLSTQFHFQVKFKLLSDRPMESAWSPIQTSHDHPPPSV